MYGVQSLCDNNPVVAGIMDFQTKPSSVTDDIAFVVTTADGTTEIATGAIHSEMTDFRALLREELPRKSSSVVCRWTRIRGDAMFLFEQL